MDWPEYAGVNYARLGNWNKWLGFFERPQAADDFAGVYDTQADEGVVRVFPASVVSGSKGFGMGWSNKIDPDSWTDDDSTYVEIHGGVAPTFWDAATLAPGQALEWTEYWYPVSGIGWLTAATDEAVLGVSEGDGRSLIGVHATAPHAEGESVLRIWRSSDCAALGHWDLPAVGPGVPALVSTLADGASLNDVIIVYTDEEDQLLAAANFADCLPPRAWIEPLPSTVETSSFDVGWAGEDAWSPVTAYSVQVRDGYLGAWTDWLTSTAATSAVFTGTHGNTIFFRARARDAEGNWSAFTSEEWGQSFTTVLTRPAPVLATSRKVATPTVFAPYQAVSYTVVISNTGTSAATAALTDALPEGMALLTRTLTASQGSPPVHTTSTISWSGLVTPGGEVRLTYSLSPTEAVVPGAPLTNTVDIGGSVLGPIRRRQVVVQLCTVWLPVALRPF
jgi:uncharacterized repeat protein (TIGR01451 family)